VSDVDPADRAAAAARRRSRRHSSASPPDQACGAGSRCSRRVNQVHGFDCPACAWPDPRDRTAIEFCENGAKAVAHETTRKRLAPEFFAEWSISALREQSDHWLEQQGRLVEPLRRAPGASHYAAVSWEEAFAGIARALGALRDPDEAIFYTSGRTSNEAAFLYQLFARSFGTNNLPDCSNLCHESSGVGLTPVIGVGKGTVGLDDFALADAIFVIGQNPGSNHPRMLTALQAAKRRGARIVAINPLRERGLVRFATRRIRDNGSAAAPRSPISTSRCASAATSRCSRGSPRRCSRRRIAGPDACSTGRSCPGARPASRLSRGDRGARLGDARGAERDRARRDARGGAEYTRATRVIACWAMGITQHEHGVANVQEIVNLLLLRGNIGVPGAGACPVRGHSNVQGDRTVGITEKPRAAFLDALAREFDFARRARTAPTWSRRSARCATGARARSSAWAETSRWPRPTARPPPPRSSAAI
jgi:anaerobic selenocysteine-containing dehydrogenase